MKTFHCDTCGSLVFFENVTCLHCRHVLGFLPDVLDLSALEPAEPGTERALASAARDRRYRRCANDTAHSVCNWRIPVDDSSEFCVACRLNEIIPNLLRPGNRDAWHRLEHAKRRLVYTLLQLRLPLSAESGAGVPGLRFRFLADTPDGPPALTGHANGVITINLAEADDAVREQRRASLHEPFRTLLGHFRHEVGHYLWDRLIRPTARLAAFRRCFGDEQSDYAAALQRHYHDGPPADWSARFVSAYASAHPWEDWAESTAHYLHIIDTLETAAGFGLTLRPKHPAASTMTADARRVAATGDMDFEMLLATWFPLTYALNSLNRGVGLPDLYPFVLPPPAVDKLRFVHDTLQAARSSSSGQGAGPALAA